MSTTERVIELGGDLTLEVVEDIAQMLRSRIDESSRVAIDLRAVGAMDGAGLQTLISARHSAFARGVEWGVAGWSHVVAKLLDDFRCADLLDGRADRFQRQKWGHLISGPVPSFVREDEEMIGRIDNDCWHLSIRFGLGAFVQGTDPIWVLRQLYEQGTIARVKLVHSRLPRLSALCARDCHLGLEVDIRARTRPELVTASGVYVFGVLPPFSPVSVYRDLFYRLPEDPRRTALDWWDMGSITDQELGRLQPSLAASMPSVPSLSQLGQSDFGGYERSTTTS